MKIIQAINSMIENQSKITNVIQTKEEMFFVYNDKYKWSISESPNEQNEIFLHLYPDKNMSIEELSQVQDWQAHNFVTYKVSDFKTQEAFETFNELYQIVKSKIYGVDDLLDEIISGF
ncbi:hypothetical protein VOI54_12265 [Tamlana sp. 2201CG12-4]|uniref:hypothetical protein n=1 Tax=Tamlana sp. 2201CG12-4 TaxID=3112582 RepID=UPI002DC04028|nr:hypothetical protein [Tamlana sp. 2201CG12-4]MEC3907796.1 hypothetical protein [Tamlana sp. 2201CG12-4]